ncbi:MAG: hypothetical protein ACR2KL_10020 [Nocardioidaceae bacterium]
MKQLLAAVALAVLGVAACGSTSTTQPAVASPKAPQSSAAPEARSVTVVQTGGLAGSHSTWRVTAGTRHSARVFTAANKATLQPLAAHEPVTAPCCDRFSYTVVVRYADGSRLSVSTFEGDSKGDGTLNRLLAAVFDATVERPDTPPKA